MPSPASHQSATDRPNLTPKILPSRSQYRACHIRLPGETQRLAAVLVEGQYYSLFKVVKDRSKALETCARLASRGNQTVITQTAKGDAIWILEPDAYQDSARATSLTSTPQADNRVVRVIESRNDYKSCHIRVPDLDKPMAAIQVEDKYYGLLKVVDTRQQAIDVAQRLLRKGNEAVVTRLAQGFGIWVWEAEARPDL